MIAHRRVAAAALAVGLLALASAHGWGQGKASTDQYKKDVNVSGAVRQDVSAMRDSQKPFTKENLPAMQDSLDKMAKYLVYRVTWEKEFHKQPEPTNNELKPANIEFSVETLMNELSRFIIVPQPGVKLTTEQGDFIKYFGIAVDKPLNDVLKPVVNPDYIRVNAARMLALAARSGAPAHAPTITRLLADPKTRPEILIHAIHAAENLLAAYDMFLLSTVNQYKHTISDAELINLIKALQAIAEWEKVPFPVTSVDKRPSATPEPGKADPKAAASKLTTPAPATPLGGTKSATPAAPANPPAATPPAPTGKAGGTIEATQESVEKLSPEQMAVLHYYRRAAVRALAKVREPIVIDTKTNATAYPMYTLAQFAVDDAKLPHRPFPDEAAEAVIGLCGYQAFKGVNPDVMMDIVAAGITNFARKKVDLSDDKSIEWRVYSARISAALNDWKKTAGNSPTINRSAPKVASLGEIAIGNVLYPIEKMGASGTRTPNLENVANWAGGPKPELAPFIENPGLKLLPTKRAE